MKKALFMIFMALILVSSVFAISGIGPLIDGQATTNYGFAIPIDETDWARQASLDYDKDNSKFSIDIINNPSSVNVGDPVKFKARVKNTESTSEHMYVQCAILDKTGQTYLGDPRASGLGRALSITPVGNCVANEPYSKTLSVTLFGGESTDISFSINAPAYPAGAQPVISCDTYERCASQGDPYGYDGDVVSLTINPGVVQCTSSGSIVQKQCVDTTHYQACSNGKWGSTQACPSGQLCKSTNGECYTPTTCEKICVDGQKRCLSETTYQLCTKNSVGCWIWGGSTYKVSAGYTCNNGLVSTLEPCKDLNGNICTTQSCADSVVKCVSPTTYKKCQKAEGMAYAVHPTIYTTTSGQICQNNKLVSSMPSTPSTPGVTIPVITAPSTDQLSCYTCQGNNVVQSLQPRTALVPQMTFFEQLSSLFSRSATTTALCENAFGYYTNFDFVCAQGHVVTNPDYFSPEVTSFKVADCKTKDWAEIEQADLSCYGPGDEVEWELSFRNKATYSTSRASDMAREAGFDAQKTEAYAKKFGNTWFANFEKWIEDKTASVPILGHTVEGLMMMRESTWRWVQIQRGIDYDTVKAAYNFEQLKTTPITAPIVEVAFRSQSAGKQYYGYSSALARQGNTYLTGSMQYQYVPGCKVTSEGKNEDTYGYLKSAKVLFAPIIDGKCNKVGTVVDIEGDKVFAACDYTMYGKIEVPNSGDLIGEEGISNVDPQGKYYLQASVFDECWDPRMSDPSSGIPATISADKVALVQTEIASDISVCCQVSGQQPFTTVMSKCTGTIVDATKCAATSQVKTTVCYDCDASGVISATFSSESGTPKCNSDDWNTKSYRFSTRDDAVKSCLNVPPEDQPEQTHVCWACFADNSGAYEVVLPIAQPCAHTDANECGGSINYKNCYICDASKSAGYDLTQIDESLPCPTQYPLSEENWIAADRCVAPPGIGTLFIDPEDSDYYCVSIIGKSKHESCAIHRFERKNPIEIGQLDELKETGFWENVLLITGKDIIENPDNPICFPSSGNVQCKDNSICLRAEKGDRGTDANKVYDALLEDAKLDPTRWNGLIPALVSTIEVTIGGIIGVDFEEIVIENNYGVCVYEQRDTVSTIKRWFANLFGLNINDKYFSYYFYGAIAAIVIIIWLMIRPRPPRYVQGGMGQ